MPIYIHESNWMTTAISKADAVIIPTPGRASILKDRNKNIQEKFNCIPGSLRWFINYYIGRNTVNDIVNAASGIGCISPTQNYSKDLTASIQRSFIASDLKPKDTFGENYFKALPSVIGIGVCDSLHNFDVHRMSADSNFMLTAENKKINGSIRLALVDAITSIKNKNNTSSKPNIYIAPLLREAGYIPPINSPLKINNDWAGINYINAMIMTLSQYKLDNINVHLFHRIYNYTPDILVN